MRLILALSVLAPLVPAFLIDTYGTLDCTGTATSVNLTASGQCATVPAGFTSFQLVEAEDTDQTLWIFGQEQCSGSPLLLNIAVTGLESDFTVGACRNVGSDATTIAKSLGSEFYSPIKPPTGRSEQSSRVMRRKMI